MNFSTKKIIERFSKKWGVPTAKLIVLYKIYQKTAVDCGTLSAILKLLGFVLDRRKIAYLIKKLRRACLTNNDSKFS